jgi:hypothetical protein
MTGCMHRALSAYALETRDPAEVFGPVNRKVQHFEPDALATVLYAVIDPAPDRMDICRAGIPPGHRPPRADRVSSQAIGSDANCLDNVRLADKVSPSAHYRSSRATSTGAACGPLKRSRPGPDWRVVRALRAGRLAQREAPSAGGYGRPARSCTAWGRVPSATSARVTDPRTVDRDERTASHTSRSGSAAPG